MTDLEQIAKAIEDAGLKWKAENGGDAASFADVPEIIFARAAVEAMDCTPAMIAAAKRVADGTPADAWELFEDGEIVRRLWGAMKGEILK